MNIRHGIPTAAGMALLSGVLSLSAWAQNGGERPGDPSDISTATPPDEVIRGDRLSESHKSPGRIETMQEVIARDIERQNLNLQIPDGRNGQPGTWVIPSRGGTFYPHSGRHYITNKWGDTRMGIAFPQLADFQGTFVAGQARDGIWATRLRAIGYRDGELIDQTDWFLDIDETPSWFEVDFRAIDRIVFEAEPVFRGSAWFSLDDLKYTLLPRHRDEAFQDVTLDFEDCAYRDELTGSGYAGLIWETGTGDFIQPDIIHVPESPVLPDDPGAKAAPAAPAIMGAGSSPIIGDQFQGVIYGDASSFTVPPDTCGAIGPNHYVEVVNRNFAVYDRFTGTELLNVNLTTFLPGSSGDPRILWDQYSNRYIVAVSDFDTKLFLAVSMTDDPTGAWFKTDFVASVGSDDGCWPDHETLGVNENGIYMGAFMVGCGMTIFAIDKAPLITPSPSLGTVTAFRGLSTAAFAIHPVHSFGTTDGEYLISLNSSATLRMRKITGPLTGPTLTDLGTVSVPSYGPPPDAPALGSTTDISTIDARPTNAMFRNGSVWMAHNVTSSFGTAGCRWYQIDPLSLTVQQMGTVEDPSLHYYYGSIAVNADDNVVMGFSGSNESQFVGCYFTGRLSSDPAGVMATPTLFKAGNATYTILDGFGRNRWGDYSLTSIDPLDDRSFYTIQEYVEAVDTWGTWIAQFTFCLSPPAFDCNGNCVADDLDISGATSLDCNNNGIPDECDLFTISLDCNLNDIPDECEDCDGNGIADECDLIAFLDDSSGQLSPFGFFTDVQYTIFAPPTATGDVTLEFHALGVLNFGFDNIDVSLNGSPIGTIFDAAFGDNCPTVSGPQQVILTAAIYNALIAGGDALFNFHTEAQFLPGDCGGAWISVDTSYPANSSVDLNDNGILDVCECDADCAATGPDTNVDVLDLIDLLANWGSGTVCDFSPPGGDGQIDVLDLIDLLAAWGTCAP